MGALPADPRPIVARASLELVMRLLRLTSMALTPVGMVGLLILGHFVVQVSRLLR